VAFQCTDFYLLVIASHFSIDLTRSQTRYIPLKLANFLCFYVSIKSQKNLILRIFLKFKKRCFSKTYQLNWSFSNTSVPDDGCNSNELSRSAQVDYRALQIAETLEGMSERDKSVSSIELPNLCAKYSSFVWILRLF